MADHGQVRMQRRGLMTGLVLATGAVGATLALLFVAVALPAMVAIAQVPQDLPSGWRTMPRATPAGGAIAVAGDAGVWPLDSRCYRSFASGRTPTAADHKVLGDIEAVVLANFPVTAGQLGRPSAGTSASTAAGSAGSCARALWKTVQALYPPQALALIDRYVVFEGPLSESIAGEVTPDDAGATKWTLAISMLDAEDLPFIATHELGHLLSLNPTEVDPAAEPTGGCDTYDSSQGCSRSGSILDDYTANTWHQDLLDTWFDIDSGHDDAKRDAALGKLYADNPTEFVDAYAATDPDEDFAETFAAWCLGHPLASTTLARKAGFMDHRHELVGMKARCRAVFGKPS